jgi:hypothetical protein
VRTPVTAIEAALEKAETDDDRIVDSRPNPNEREARRRRATLKPHGMLEPAPSLSRPPGQRRANWTPPWGTPVHNAERSAKSEPPRSALGSEIPIPLTRRTFAAVSGGTQRPPPLVDPADSALGEGYPVDSAHFRQIVEVNELTELAYEGGAAPLTTTSVVGTPSRAYPTVLEAGTEALATDEIRVTVLGSGDPFVKRGQASASVLVEVGNQQRIENEREPFTEGMRTAENAVVAATLARAKPVGQCDSAAGRAGALKPPVQSPENGPAPVRDQSQHGQVQQRRHKHTGGEEPAHVGVIGQESVDQLPQRVADREARADQPQPFRGEHSVVQQRLFR